MNAVKQNLLFAQQEAQELFAAVEDAGLIAPGKTERQLNDEVVKLAHEAFSAEGFWHKKIIRAGANTMEPYSADPPDLTIQDDDIVILDFGPIFGGYEADFARTYVIGNDPKKLKLKNDVAVAWVEANAWCAAQSSLTGADCFKYLHALANRYGYEYAGEIGGHIVGPYPHEQLAPGDLGLDIHPGNHQNMFLKDPQGNDRNWILEIHFVDKANQIGGFFEQLMN